MATSDDQSRPVASAPEPIAIAVAPPVPPTRTEVVTKTPEPSPSPPSNPVPPVVAPPSTSPVPPPPSVDPFWQSPLFERRWALASLSPQEEVRFGQVLHDLILHFNKTVDEGPWLRRVEEAAAPLLEARARKEIPYTFTVLAAEEPNAFSHPGGFVYVSKGLFDLFGEDEEAALQFALAHEIAHVDLRHAQACLTDKGIEEQAKGTLQQLYFVILPLAYPDSLEFQADRWASDRLRALERSPLEIRTFLLRLENYANAHKFGGGRDRQRLKVPGTSPVENHYRSHTATYKRLNELRKGGTPPTNPSAASPRR